MSKWSRTAGLLFLAASAVYSDQALFANSARAANSDPAANVTPDDKSGGGVKLLDDPFAATGPTTEPTSQPTAVPPSGGNQSVSSSDVSVSDAGTVEIH